MKTATLAQAQQVLNLILQKKVGAERIQTLIESGLLGDILMLPFEDIGRAGVRDFRGYFGEAARDAFLEMLLPKQCVVRVDRKAIEFDAKAWAKCHYDEVSALILNTAIPHLSGGYSPEKVHMEFVNYKGKKEIRCEEARGLIPKHFRGANLYELMWLGVQYPHIQKIRRVVALVDEYLDPIDQKVCPMLISYGGAMRKVGYTAEVLKGDLLAVVSVY